MKPYLKALFLSRIGQGSVDAYILLKHVGESCDSVRAALLGLVELGYVTETEVTPSPQRGEKGAPAGPVAAKFSLSEKGRKELVVVMAGGVFDILHVGHLASFEEARGLGDLLVVVVARDTTVKRLKNRVPINNEAQRVRLLNALSVVDLAVLGDESEFLSSIERIAPDIIAIGYDQKHDAAELKRDLDLRGLPTRIIRLKSHVPGIKSSKILSRIQDVNSLI
ncbi:FAD synthase [Candidatus Bathyarchaeota archaeon]|nr:FAD synthase [Candidatus Bathyarchaeota archaeon]